MRVPERRDIPPSCIAGEGFRLAESLLACAVLARLHIGLSDVEENSETPRASQLIPVEFQNSLF